VSIVGYLNGEKILSRTQMGEPADFHEAIAKIIEQSPLKDQIMRASGGGPSTAGNIENHGGTKVIKVTTKQMMDPQFYRKIQKQSSETGAKIVQTD
jgi:hypothetical protein